MPVTPERYARLWEIYDDALRSPAEGRAAFLDRVCGGDRELRVEVDRLLAHAGDTPLQGLLDTPCVVNLKNCLLGPPAVEPAPAPPPAGSTGCAIEAEVGRGGMGVVYRARDRHGRVVAVKTLQGLSPTAVYRFKREFRSLAGLSHPNLAGLYELVADGPRWFLVMEFVEGTDFLTHVRAGPPASAADRLRHAIRQLAGGLAALHAAGVLHRDVKPANVIVGPDGRAVLLDFGLAADLDRSGVHANSDGVVLGTFDYMSPEQTAGEAVSPAADWYSVGVMLYEALTGRRPFQGSPLAVLEDRFRRDPAPPSELVPDAPEDLDRLCRDLLRRDPAARPTGAEVLARLGADPAPPPGPQAGLLVGRGGPLAELTAAFRSVAAGPAAVVRVSGPSGVGKTALVQAFLDGVTRRHPRAVVLAGKCYEQESVPYKALDPVVDALSRFLQNLPPLEVEALLPRDVGPLTGMFPVLARVRAVAEAPRRPDGPADQQELRRRAFGGLRELLARLGGRRPLVVCIDDLQWGDADSAAALGEVLRPPDAPALLLVLCYRSDETSGPALRTLLEATDGPGRAAGAREIAVAPLTPDDTRRMAVALMKGVESARHVEAVVRESGGNPLFAWELLQAAEAGRGQADGEAGPTLDRVIWDRVARLPAGGRELLTVLAVAGRAVPADLACRAAGVHPGDAALLGTLRAGRLVRTAAGGDDRIAPYHDRVREPGNALDAPNAVGDPGLHCRGEPK
jgi:hypothetical protein